LSRFGDTMGSHHGVNLEMHSEAVIELLWICTGCQRSIEFGDAHGGHNRPGLGQYLEEFDPEEVNRG